MQTTTISTVLLIGVGILNLLPIAGVLGVGRLEAAYGVVVDGPNMAVLLRHRAVLLGLVGGLVLVSVWLPALRPAASITAGISMLSFCLVALVEPGYTAEVGRIVKLDVAGLIALGGAVLLR